MKQETKQQIGQSIADFRLPRYNEIPNVGLYLEQATKYVCEYLAPLGEYTLTPSMISNYVKKGLIANPVKKQYGREQIAYLFFIALSKTVISIEDLKVFIQLQQRTYPTEVAYEYFCSELENVLFFIFGLKDTLDTVGVESTDEKMMLRNAIIAVAHKAYLDKCFACMHDDV